MKKMLIDAARREEQVRVALVDNRTLYELNIDKSEKEQKKSKKSKKASISKGKLIRKEPSINAVFVEYGPGRNGFLPVKEIAPEYFDGEPDIDNLAEGQEFIVQVDKEERGNKGAALTTYICLAGCYLVLMPNNPRAGGISRRIEGDERRSMRDILDNLDIPDGMGVIVRTAGIGRKLTELQWDLSTLLKLWQAIQEVADSKPAPLLIHREVDAITGAIREYLRPDIDEMIINQKEAYHQAREYLKHIKPDFLNKVKLHKAATPLFESYGLEKQIESAFSREVLLDNGASIIIDVTEALISIDINSARAKEGSDIEETALKTNLLAASEIAKQLRLRDLGGLIVVDFIDMLVPKNQRLVENKMKEAVEADRAKIQIGRISKFGLLEMSRQRMKPSLDEISKSVCPVCNGKGNLRSIESIVDSIIREIKSLVNKPSTKKVVLNTSPELASYLLNEKRSIIIEMESRTQVQIVIIPNKYNLSSEYHLETADTTEKEIESSYDLIKDKTDDEAEDNEDVDSPIITSIADFNGDVVENPSLFSRIWGFFFGPNKDKNKKDNRRRGRGTDRRNSGNSDRRNNKDRRTRNSKRQSQTRDYSATTNSSNNTRDNRDTRDNRNNKEDARLDRRDDKLDNRDERDERDNAKDNDYSSKSRTQSRRTNNLKERRSKDSEALRDREKPIVNKEAKQTVAQKEEHAVTNEALAEHKAVKTNNTAPTSDKTKAQTKAQKPSKVKEDIEAKETSIKLKSKQSGIEFVFNNSDAKTRDIEQVKLGLNQNKYSHGHNYRAASYIAARPQVTQPQEVLTENQISDNNLNSNLAFDFVGEKNNTTNATATITASETSNKVNNDATRGHADSTSTTNTNLTFNWNEDAEEDSGFVDDTDSIGNRIEDDNSSNRSNSAKHRERKQYSPTKNRENNNSSSTDPNQEKQGTGHRRQRSRNNMARKQKYWKRKKDRGMDRGSEPKEQEQE